jgi:uncharacterized membrane protein YcaP (DUF421 family)
MTGILLELSTVAWHTLVIYVFLILSLSLLGHRETTQLSPVEIVIIMILGSAVETSMVAGDTSLLAGLTSAAILLLCNWGFTRLLNRWRGLRRVLIGHPIPLVYNGKILPKRMQAAGLSQDNLLEGVRQRGYEDLQQVRFAVLETDGSISVVPMETGKGRKKPSKG